MLTSAVIESLKALCKVNVEQTSCTSVHYFFFDSSNPAKKTTEACVRNLMRQVCQTALYNEVSTIWEKSIFTMEEPTLNELLGVMKDVLRRSGGAFIVLDALDECCDTEDLLNTLATIQTWELPGIRIFTTSRPNERIRHVMSSIAVHISLSSDIVSESISLFLEQEFRDSRGRLHRWAGKEEDKRDIRGRIRDKIDQSKGL